MNELHELQKRCAVEIGRPETVNVVLAGCGGTGSFLALHLARLAYHARHRHGIELRLLLVDPDAVEDRNVGRQNFCPAEVGRPKAETLAARFSLAFGIPIACQVDCFYADSRPITYLPRHRGAQDGSFHLVIGCVDNAAGRREIHQAVKHHDGALWWLDCGNHENAGQVLLGNRVDLAAPEISPLGFCAALPAPSVVHQELLEPPPALDVASPSCAELALADIQSLMINQAIAGWAANFVARLLLSRDLDIRATYLDLVTGSARSIGISREMEANT